MYNASMYSSHIKKSRGTFDILFCRSFSSEALSLSLLLGLLLLRG
jgi:hypothetical protein